MKRKLLFLLLVLGFAFTAKAQLSDLHYLPPLKQGQNNAAIQQQAIYLSTPEPTTFRVNVYRGTNPATIATFDISNVSPAVYTLSEGDNNITLVDNANTGIVLSNSGLRFESPSGNRFYVNYRGSSSAQSASLTSKGRVAMGTRFKWGGVPNLGAHISKSNTLGIMATEANTTITLSGYDPNCEFRLGGNVAGITANSYTVTLDANESFVFENYVGNSPTVANSQGWIGASLVSDKDIVISNGSLNFGRQAGAGNRDAGIDQTVPETKLGKEYIFIRGNGNTNGSTEFPLLIGIADNTQIYVNGLATPIATINNGDYFEVPSSYYSSNTVGANMLVETSKNVYAYQCMAGASQVYTQGLNFVAPVNCLLPDVMDNIPDIRNMAGTQVTGGLTITAAVNTPDANIVVSNGTTTIPLPPSVPVAGSTDWKTFYIPNLDGNISVQSTGPMAIGFIGYNGARGVAGYFSGFDTVPKVDLEIRGGTGCFVGSTIFEATGNFDAYQWYGDGVLIPGANAPSYAPGIAGQYFVRGTKGPCTYDSQTINALYCDPDIVINKTVDKAEIMEGETATFSISIRNLGVGPLTNLQLTDNIPVGLTLESAVTISGTWSGNTWNVGTLNGGETAELELQVRADEIDILALIKLTNTVTHTQDQTDTNVSEDIPTANIIVHNDFDNDGVKDITDLDDDNDGIYDDDECSTTICFETIVNESFESPVIPNSSWRLLNENTVPGWETTSTDGRIEFWSNNFLGVPSFDGNQIAELNGTQNSALYQNLCLTPGTVMEWSLRHRGRSGVDVMRVRIGADLATATQQQTMSDGTSAWGYYSGTYTVPAGQNNTVFIFEAVSTSGGSLSVGNLIDDVKISVAAVSSCDDTDSDGYPDNLDLDSDGDGCSDANEYYKDENADGGDGGTYGSGTPVVDPTTGTVNTASYTKVVAPEIILGNTSEDLGGNDINGQDIGLGQSLEYVLRFQNTGDDHAVNYTIIDELPANVTFDNVDISNAPGVTYTHDVISNVLNFSIPNNLVQIGDPQYSIRIAITTASNCSQFTDACSSQLDNSAFSTYRGTINTGEFTDANGSASITGCPITPQVASNSIYNALANCNEARTVQLCGDDVVLQAGSGFTTYIWVSDTNGNGQVDASDTVVNDGDPDNDPSTVLVTTTGTYIVAKTSTSGCPDLVERIIVERFGTTQTNPILNYFNQVNSDGNPDNDLQGEVVTCSIDGDVLPKIFLCGADDEATIQLGITDAESIVWQKLNEGSCSDTGDDCANKNGTCTWTDVSTANDYTLTESGEYRIVITYQNGCFSRFYFNVFKNELDVEFTTSDILCTTVGNIRITNVGSGYGFQLLNALDDSILIPFSANNGPNFDIVTSGTYKVLVTQLNPTDGTPIANSCIFETEDIGIQERDFSVTLSTTPADCNQLGTVTVQALNALPNYSYELRLDDGSNGGLGSLVNTIPSVNDNTHTFSNINPENYIVVTTTQDGCLDSQTITVDEIPDLNLSAVNSQNISCAAGIVTLIPSGGNPSPNYEMAIWSIDGIDLYADPSDVPPTALQTTTNFLIRTSAEAGEYIFVVFDATGCHAFSNSVLMEDLGTPTLTASHTDIICSGSATSDLTVGVTGGTAPYQYSLDGGLNYQTTDTFFDLAAGIYTITVMDSSNNGGVGCIETLEYEVTQPFRLTASATIVEDASCNPSGALVKIANANGGQAPYEYSFDGGSSFTPTDAQHLLSGNYQLVVKDALGCEYPMDLTVPNTPTDPSFDSAVTYACDGLGEITITPSNTTDFTYSYSLNGTDNSPIDANTFSNVPNGTHTVSIGYATNLTPAQSTLFSENFGAGPNTQIGEIGPGYCYEPQDGSATNCNLGPAGILVNGEYTVTNFITNPVIALNPNDHSSITDGRFLAIDVSTLAGDKGVLWARRDLEVLPNREITLSFWAFNLLRTTGNGNNPEVLVELVDASGTVISSIPTAEIPKNTNADDWHLREVTFDPGVNTIVDIVLRSNLNSDFGNDLVLDDIQAIQQPEACDKTVDLTVVVEDNKAFTSTFISSNDPSCNGTSDGSIRFEVSNFDSVTGFEYSTDGGTNWVTSLSSPTTTAATLAASTYNILVRRQNDTSCTANFNATLTEPAAIVPVLNQTADFTCFTTGGTLEASATGGSPGYEYQLENTATAIIVAYQDDGLFENIVNGSYVVRVKDDNGCEVVSTVPVTIDAPETIDFDLTSTACYDGLNNASITATVTTGNGTYNFRINGGAWITPTPSTASAHTFTGLANGTYDIEVTDSFGCVSNVESITIEPALTAQVLVTDVTACANGTIMVNATGGDMNFTYAFLVTGTTVTDADFGPSSSFAVTNATVGTYDVYVRDNSGTSPYCQFLETVTVQSAPVLAFTATPTDAICFGDSGSIAVTITSGVAPYDYELIDIDNGTASQVQSSVLATSKTYFNLTPGEYTVILTDANGCDLSVTGIEIAEPDELTATISGITPANCTGDVNDFGFAFSAYPTTLGTIQFSADGGTTWTGDNSAPGTSDELRGYLSGNTVYPSMRTIDGSNNTVCQTDLPPYIIPYPLDDLDITILPIIVNCNELQVTVRGQNGTAPYLYTYTEDPGNFNDAAPVNGWVGPFPLGTTHTFTGLIPGRTYSFYVRDSSTPLPGCVRQSSVNVNDIVTNPMEITATFEPSCDGADDGEITYTITDSDGSTEPQMSWALFDIDDNLTPITTSGGPVPYAPTVTLNGLAPNEYYLVVTQIDAGGTIQCTSASENLILEELDPITASLRKIQDISCEQPGIIIIESIQGGGGTYNYTVTGPAPFVTITGTTDNPVEIAPNSPEGNYSVTISDQFGCSYPLGNVSLSLTENPVITSLNVDNCGPSTTVTIHANSPDSATLLYSIDGGTTYFDNGGIFSSVIPGSYTGTVKDGNGCSVSQAFDVYQGMQATASLEKSLGCGVGQEAEIEIEVTAGTGSGSFEYEILDSSLNIIAARQVLASNPLTVAITTAEIYTVKVYDTTSNPECERVFTIEVPPAVVPDFSADPTDISCSGNTDGAITLTQVNNGNNPLTYTLTPNSGSYNAATATFEDLPAGTYEVTGTGPNGCVLTISNIPVIEPATITFSAPTVTPFGCTTGNDPNNASIEINIGTITGGSGTFVRFEFEADPSGTLLQNGTNSNYTFTDLSGGDVIVRVYDDKGCSGEVTVTVPSFDELNTATIHIDEPISCINLGEDITIDVIGSLSNFTSDPGNYSFRRLPSGPVQASNIFPDLPAGTHTFAVRNINTGCEITINHIVNDPNTFDFSVEKLADVVCFGDNGSIRLTMTDATYASSFTWQIFETNGTPTDRSDDGVAISTGTSPDFGPTTPIAVPAGNYIVEVVQDGFPNCGQIKSFNITTPSAALALDPISLTEAGCSNDQGSASIKPTGGVAPYDITLTNMTTTAVLNAVQINTKLFQGLAAGQYDVLVTDALGCSSTFTTAFELVVPDPISGTISATDLVCKGDTDAILDISLAARNVSSNYRYRLNTYSDNLGSTLVQSTTTKTTSSFDNLGPGFYTITVLDDMGCSFESPVHTIVEPTETNGMLLTSATLSCQTDAELELTATGGTGPYMWSIDGVTFNAMNEINGPDTHLFQNITAGSYEYFIRDSFNCISTLSNEITINPLEDLTLDVDRTAAVINCNGDSTAVIIAIADGGLGNYQYGLFSDSGLTNEIRPYQNTGTFADLPQGTYYVNVQSEDCELRSDEILISEPDVLEVTSTITDISCNGSDDGSIVLDVQGGSGAYQYAISPNLNQFDDKNSFDDLAVGDYSVIVQDAQGCFELIEFSITEPDALTLALTATPEICVGDADGSITVTITGGTAPYSTALNSDADADFVEGRLTFENLTGDDYFIYIKDANGCTLDDLIRVETGANLAATLEVIYECTGDSPNNRLSIALEDDTVAADILYAMDSADPNDLVLTPDFTNLTPGTHALTIAHANGCVNTIDFEVEGFEPLELTLEQLSLNEITANAGGGKEGYTYYFNEENNGDDNSFYIRRTDTYVVRVVDENGCEATASIYMEFIDIEIPNFFTPDGDGKNDIWVPRNITQFPDIFITIFDRYGREVYRIKDNEDGWNGLYQEADLPTGDYWYVIKLNGADDEREFVGHFTLYR